MTATLNPKLPAYAVPFWTDGTTIFAAIPVKGSPLQHHIIKYPYSSDGLHQALRLLASSHSEAPAAQRFDSPAIIQTRTQIARAKLQALGIIPK